MGFSASTEMVTTTLLYSLFSIGFLYFFFFIFKCLVRSLSFTTHTKETTSKSSESLALDDRIFTASSSIKHDVFLSFRGEDTRDNFTSHLYYALRRKKINTYIDYELHKGDEISPNLLKAIEESKISVIIFSTNYASSTWCLDELFHILFCKEMNEQIVIPIFYNGVSPSQVRKQEGSYATALAVLEKRFAHDLDKVRRWRRALESVASISGWDSSVTKMEAELIEKIVEDVLEKLRRTVCAEKNEYKDLVGMHKRVEKVVSMLQIGSSDVRIVGLWGMAGIGKTTLARAVFDRLSSQFDGCCFVENIAKKLETLGEEGLKKEVFFALLNDNKSSSLSKFGELTSYDYNRLRRSKVLIVLDNLKYSELLKPLADVNLFGLGSRVLVTTKDQQVIRNRIDDNQIYKVERLNCDEALQLFSLRAFSKNLATVNCQEIAKEVVKYCNGHPLALTVLGSSFGGKSEQMWKDAFEKVQQFPNNNIQNWLEMSYDELDDEQKGIFLHIACFFEGKNKEIVEGILDACGFKASIGVDDLIDKSLVMVVNDELRMHSLLQETGQQIVRRQSEDPGKRSRLWDADDVSQVLQDNTGAKEVEGIIFNMSELKGKIDLDPAIFQGMGKLRLLIFYNHDPKMCKVYLPQDTLGLPNRLRYLHWVGYPSKALPTISFAARLVELIMPNSQVEELWRGDQDLMNLRKIDLSYSENLRELSGLCQARNLEHVYLEHCPGLSQVASEIIHLDKLQTLILEGCSSLKVFPKLPSNIVCLVLNGTAIEEVPSSVGNLTELKIFSMRDCKRLVSLPITISRLKILVSLALSGCEKLETFPEISEPMWSLTMLELDQTSIGALSKLTTKNMPVVEHFVFEDHKLVPYNICSRLINVHNICNCLWRPHTNMNLSHMMEASKCISLIELNHLLGNSKLNPSSELLYAKWCPKLEIASVLSGKCTSAKPMNYKMKFFFYNKFQFRRCSNSGEKDHIISSGYKLLETEIPFPFETKNMKFVEADVGVCYHRKKLQNLLGDQSENYESSRRITLKIENIRALLGFEVFVKVKITEHELSKVCELRVVCEAHYQLSDGRLLSWDFHFDNETQLMLNSSRVIAIPSDSIVKFYRCVDSLNVEGAVFDFYVCDGNNKPIQNCRLNNCTIEPIFEDRLFDDKFRWIGCELLYYDIVADRNKQPTHRHTNISHMVESSKCISLVQLKHIFGNSTLKLPFQLFYAKWCPKIEIASVSSESLRSVASDCYNKEFCFYNSFEFRRYRNSTAQRIIRRKFLDRENAFIKGLGLRIESDTGVCSYRETKNPKLVDQFDKNYESSGRITLNIRNILKDLLGFAICANVKISDYELIKINKLRVVCEAHYQLSDDRLLSWDIYFDNETQLVPHNSRGFAMTSNGKQKFDSCVESLKVEGAVFDFYVLDENNKPIQCCRLSNCRIKLLFKDDLKNDEFQSGGYGLL